MGIFTLPDLANIFLSVLQAILLNIAFGGASALMLGLVVWRIPTGGGGANSSDQQAGANSRLTRRERKKEISEDLEGADNIGSRPLSQEEVKDVFEQMDFYKELDTMLFTFQLAASSAVFGELLDFVFAIGRTHLAPLLLIIAVSSALAVLFKVEFMSAMTPTRERAIMMIIGMLALIASLFLLMGVPDDVIDWREKDAAMALEASIREALQSRIPTSNKLVTSARVNDLWFQLMMSAFAASSAALLWAASKRTMRSFSLALRVPPYIAQKHPGEIKVPWLVTLGLLVDMVVLPLSLIMLWVKPVSLGLWGLSEDQAEAAKGMGMVAYGLLHGLLFRPYMQLFLHHALVVWGSLRYNANIRDGAKVGQALRQRVQVVNGLMCKVAVQTLAPAILFASLGLMLVTNWLMGFQAQLGMLNVVGMRFFARQSWAMFAHFGAFWVTTIWFAFNVLSFAAMRAGILGSM